MCSKCVERVVDTETQTHKGRIERWRNTEGIFRVKDSEALQGKHVLIVDDVSTTGATVHACISALLTVPGVRVSIFVLAKAM